MTKKKAKVIRLDLSKADNTNSQFEEGDIEITTSKN